MRISSSYRLPVSLVSIGWGVLASSSLTALAVGILTNAQKISLSTKVKPLPLIIGGGVGSLILLGRGFFYSQEVSFLDEPPAPPLQPAPLQVEPSLSPLQPLPSTQFREDEAIRNLCKAVQTGEGLSVQELEASLVPLFNPKLPEGKTALDLEPLRKEVIALARQLEKKEQTCIAQKLYRGYLFHQVPEVVRHARSPRLLAHHLSMIVYGQFRLPQHDLLLSNLKIGGQGDFFALLHAAHLFRQVYPEWTLYMISQAYAGDSFSRVDYENFGLKQEQVLLLERDLIRKFWDLSRCEEGALNSHVKKISADHKLVDMILFEKKPSTVVIEVATSRIKSPQSPLFFKEYGGGGPDNVPVRRTFKGLYQRANIFEQKTCTDMGVGPCDAGIFVLNPMLPTRFKSRRLAQLMESSYREDVFFCYADNYVGFVAMARKLHPEKSNYFIVSMSRRFNRGEKKCMFPTFDEVIYVNELPKTLPNDQKKRLYFWNPFPLANEDMLLMMSKVQLPVGVTGNISFSESMGLKRLPFYSNQPWLAAFWKNLIELARLHLSEGELLIHYLEMMKCSDKRPLRTEPYSPEEVEQLQLQWEALVEVIRQERDLFHVFVSQLNRHVLHREFPSLKQEEKELEEAFVRGALSEEEFLEHLTTTVKTHLPDSSGAPQGSGLAALLSPP